MSCKSSYRTAILRAILLLGVMMAGCELLDPQPGDVSSEEEPQETPTCNAVEYNVNVSGLGHEGHYLWLGVLQADTVVAYGRPIRLPAEEVDTHVTAQVGFWHGLAEGSYTLRVFESADSTDVGNQWNRSSAAEAGHVQLEALVEDHACCSPVDKGRGRKYCYLRKRTDGVVGLGGVITARYGELCGHPDSSNDAHSVAAINSSTWYENPQGIVWAWSQVGVGLRRHPPEQYAQWRLFYVEVRGMQYELVKWYDDTDEEMVDGINPPLDGLKIRFVLTWEASSVRWLATFEVNGYEFTYRTAPDSAWLNLASVPTGSRFEAFGEIVNWEDDMPGRPGSPCILDSLSVEQSDEGEMGLISYDASDSVWSSDSSLWQCDRPSPWTLRIWDLNPAP